MFRRGRGADRSEVFTVRAVAVSVPERMEMSILFFEVGRNLNDAAVMNTVFWLVL